MRREVAFGRTTPIARTQHRIPMIHERSNTNERQNLSTSTASHRKVHTGTNGGFQRDHEARSAAKHNFPLIESTPRDTPPRASLTPQLEQMFSIPQQPKSTDIKREHLNLNISSNLSRFHLRRRRIAVPIFAAWPPHRVPSPRKPPAHFALQELPQDALVRQGSCRLSSQGVSTETRGRTASKMKVRSMTKERRGREET